MLFGVGVLGYVGVKRFVGKTNDSTEKSVDSKKSAIEYSKQLTQISNADFQLSKINTVINQREPTLNQINNLEGSGQSTANTKRKRTTKTKRAIGQEFQVNTFTQNSQVNPSVAALGNNRFVVAWTSSGQDGLSNSVHAQRFTTAGSKVGFEFQINTYTNSSQSRPAVAQLDTGDFVVTWTSNGQDGSLSGVYAQRFSTSGVRVDGEYQVNTYTNGTQILSSIVALDSGQFVIAWQSFGQDSSTYGIYAQRFDTSGNKLGPELQVNNHTYGSQQDCNVAALSDGNFVVTWSGNGEDTSGQGVYVQLFSGNGSKVGAELQVNTYFKDEQSHSRISALNTQGFVVVWQSFLQDGSGYGIFGQLFDNAASKIGFEFQVNTFTDGDQSIPNVVASNTDGFIVVWQSFMQDDSGLGVYGQRFNNMAGRVGSEFRVNEYTTSEQGFASVDFLANGDFIITWQSRGQDGSHWGIYGKIFSPSLDGGITIPSLIGSRTYYENEACFFFEQPLIIYSYAPSKVTVRFSWPKEAGLLLGPGQANVNISAVSESGIWEATGSLDDINTVLNYMVFMPTQYYDKSVTVKMKVIDHALLNQDFDGTFTIDAIPINQPPLLGIKTLDVREGEVTSVDARQLRVTDVDTQPAELILKVVKLEHGRFERVTQPGKPLTTFTQDEINKNMIQFVTDDSGVSPSGLINVTDGQLTVGPEALTFSYTSKGSIPAAAIVVPLSAVGIVTIATGIGCWRWRQSKKRAKTRSDYPVANALRKALSLGHVDDFETTTGQSYLGVVDALNDAFQERYEFDADKMTGEALKGTSGNRDFLSF